MEYVHQREKPMKNVPGTKCPRNEPIFWFSKSTVCFMLILQSENKNRMKYYSTTNSIESKLSEQFGLSTYPYILSFYYLSCFELIWLCINVCKRHLFFQHFVTDFVSFSAVVSFFYSVIVGFF